MRISYRKRPVFNNYDLKNGKIVFPEKTNLSGHELKEAKEAISKKIIEIKQNENFRKLIAKPLLLKISDQIQRLSESMQGEVENFEGVGILIADPFTYIFDAVSDVNCGFIFAGENMIHYADSNGLTITDLGMTDMAKGMFERIFLAILGFLKYAKIETVYLKPKEKKKIVGCKYLNETKQDIEIIDSTWFTNLIKSDAFAVRGHFRLQPKKKNGEWTKELIWINEFQKKGYTREAKKLKSEDQ